MHCAELSNDNQLYVCDRVNDRIQVFKPDGTFIKEVFINKETLGSGSAWDIAFSKDPQQKYIYLADGENDRVHILDRQSLEVLTTFGEGGRQPGEFYGVHSIATDSKGNIYTTETYRGQRVQQVHVQRPRAGDEKRPGRGLAQRQINMRNSLLLWKPSSLGASALRSGVKPSCNKCPSTYISGDEIQAYLKRVEGSQCGRRSTGSRSRYRQDAMSTIGVVYRGKLTAPAPQSVAEHDRGERGLSHHRRFGHADDRSRYRRI